MNKSKFCLVLRQCRENSKLTQQQVAAALGLERSAYSYYESGTTNPSCAFVINVSRIFGIDYRILMEAVADSDDDWENDNWTSLSSTSWQEREKMYTLKKDEQNIVLAYRALSKEDKEKISEEFRFMLENNSIIHKKTSSPMDTKFEKVKRSNK